MSGFAILDLVLGMIFIFFLLSIICSSAVELWFSFMKTRARILEQWLTRIFDTDALDSQGQKIPILDANGGPTGKFQNVGQAIMDHCMVTALSKTSKSPSYINAETFVSALLDKITIMPTPTNFVNQTPATDLASYISLIKSSTLISGELKRTILSFAYQAKAASAVVASIPAASQVTAIIKSDIDHFQERLERWYDTNAERLTGAMKRRKAIPATIFFGVLITVFMNADAVAISKYLYSHPEESRQLADKAQLSFQSYKTKVDSIEKQMTDTAKATAVTVEKLEKDKEELQRSVNDFRATLPKGIPIGWENETYDWCKIQSYGDVVGKHGAGWLATLLAISLGAPFWFDMLNKIANLRSTGPKPATPIEDGDKKKNN